MAHLPTFLAFLPGSLLLANFVVGPMIVGTTESLCSTDSIYSTPASAPKRHGLARCHVVTNRTLWTASACLVVLGISVWVCLDASLGVSSLATSVDGTIVATATRRVVNPQKHRPNQDNRLKQRVAADPRWTLGSPQAANGGQVSPETVDPTLNIFHRLLPVLVFTSTMCLFAAAWARGSIDKKTFFLNFPKDPYSGKCQNGCTGSRRGGNPPPPPDQSDHCVEKRNLQ